MIYSTQLADQTACGYTNKCLDLDDTNGQLKLEGQVDKSGQKLGCSQTFNLFQKPI